MKRNIIFLMLFSIFACSDSKISEKETVSNNQENIKTENFNDKSSTEVKVFPSITKEEFLSLAIPLVWIKLDRDKKDSSLYISNECQHIVQTEFFFSNNEVFLKEDQFFEIIKHKVISVKKEDSLFIMTTVIVEGVDTKDHQIFKINYNKDKGLSHWKTLPTYIVPETTVELYYIDSEYRNNYKVIVKKCD